MGDVERKRPALVEQTLSIVAYAEMRAIMLAWAGAPCWDPLVRARAALASELEGESISWLELPHRVQDRLRADSRALLDSLVTRAGPWPFHPLGRGQIGSVAGIEAIFNAAGKLGCAHRDDDPRVLGAAVSLAEMVHNADRCRARRGT